jgi:hypothetical protein
MKRKNDENCVVANMFTVFWFNKQINLKLRTPGEGVHTGHIAGGTHAGL